MNISYARIPDLLKWTETKWIAYRDAEADLQAKIEGKTAPDETRKAASLRKSTQVRIAELRHLAKDGFSGKLPPSSVPDQSDLVGAAYRKLRNTAILRHNADLVATVIVDEKAWDTFSQLQADYDMPDSGQNSRNDIRRRAILRMDILRLAQLQDDLSVLGRAGPVTTVSSPAPAFDDSYTTVSPDHKIRIEQADGKKSWVYSNSLGDRHALPKTADELGVGREIPTVDVSEYFISPDNEWILRTQKFYHGMCGAYLYRRTNGLKYEFATKEPLDVLAWRFFQKATHADNLSVSEGGVIGGVFQSNGILRLSLNALQRLTFANVDDWESQYDLKTGIFAIPADAKEHDLRAFEPPDNKSRR